MFAIKSDKDINGLIEKFRQGGSKQELGEYIKSKLNAEQGRKLDEILGDENMVRYLFEILRKQTGQKKLDVSYMVRDEKYVSCNVTMPGLQLSDSQLQNLFTPSIDNIPYLLCRQIVRDHGEATNRRACGISAKKDNGTIYINIILPRSCKHSK